MADSAPAAYKIQVDEAKLDSLRRRLELTTLPDEVSDAPEWARGTPLKEVNRLVKYWQSDFDWRKAEAKLNEFPQQMVKVDVDGYGEVSVHCIHQRSKVKNAIPLVFSHGWPGSFIEVTKILPLLLHGDAETPAFHVVAPSLINFGFSSGVAKASPMPLLKPNRRSRRADLST